MIKKIKRNKSGIVLTETNLWEMIGRRAPLTYVDETLNFEAKKRE